MVFDGDRLETEELRVDGSLHFVLVDLQAQKNTMEILRRLNRSYPFADNEVERGVQELLGPINRRIVHQARELVHSSDAERLGSLMVEAQQFFDNYAAPACPEELEAPVAAQGVGLCPAQAAHLRRQRGRLPGRRNRPIPGPQPRPINRPSSRSSNATWTCPAWN